MQNQSFCSTEINFLSVDKMKAQFSKISNKSILVILSKSSYNRGKFHDLMSLIKEKNEIIWIDNIKANPTQVEIIESIRYIGDKTINLIICIGGGSCIDLAKAISAFYDYRCSYLSVDKITEIINAKNYHGNKDFIDIIAVPTTAGTGSELTQWATIWDSDGKNKLSIDYSMLKPKIAYIVPELTLSLSKEMTLITGLDALAHAMEAYWSVYTNELTQDLSYRAIQLIVKNLKKVLEQPYDITLRTNMCRASVLAGLAFSQTRTTACHSISYPMTFLFGIPHGIAAAMTLGEVAMLNKGYFKNDLELFEIFEQYNGIQHWLDYVSSDVINMRLSNYNISKEEIGIIVANSFTQGRMNNNPKILTEKDVYNILSEVY